MVWITSVGAARSLLEAAHIVPVDQEDPAVLALLDQEVGEWTVVPKKAGGRGRWDRPIPGSESLASMVAALLGAKKSTGKSFPFAPTLKAMTDSDSVAGGLSDGAGWGETPFPVVSTMRSGPVDTSPAPLCQMPAWESWSVPTPDSSLHMVGDGVGRGAHAHDRPPGRG